MGVPPMLRKPKNLINWWLYSSVDLLSSVPSFCLLWKPGALDSAIPKADETKTSNPNIRGERRCVVGSGWECVYIYTYTLSIHYNDIDIYIYIWLPYLFHKCVSWNREPSDTANPLRETRLEDRKIYHGFLMGKNTKKNGDLLGKWLLYTWEKPSKTWRKMVAFPAKKPCLMTPTGMGWLSRNGNNLPDFSWLQFMSAKELINGWGWRIFPTQVPSLLWLRIDFV